MIMVIMITMMISQNINKLTHCGLTLAQVMACCSMGTKPLPESMLIYHQ